MLYNKGMKDVKNSEKLKLGNQICHRLYVASNAIVRAYRPFLEHLNLTYPQYVVMMGLWENDGVEVSQLQQQTLIDGGALTLILKKLQAKNMIDICACQEDRRRKHIHLSRQGQDLKQDALKYLHQKECQAGALNETELAQLSSSLDKLTSFLTQKY